MKKHKLRNIFFKILSNYHKLEQSLRYPRSCTVITRCIDVALVNWKLKRCIFTIFQNLLGILPNWFGRFHHIWAFMTVLQWQLTQAIFSSFAAGQVWNFIYLDSAYCNGGSVLVRMSIFQRQSLMKKFKVKMSLRTSQLSPTNSKTINVYSPYT